MAKAPSPLVGYNNNVRHKGRVFHIQTEDSGLSKPHVITHLFMDGGRILKSVKKSYAEHVEASDVADIVRKLMKEQHKAMFIALRDGTFDDAIDGKPIAKADAARVENAEPISSTEPLASSEPVPSVPGTKRAGAAPKISTPPPSSREGATMIGVAPEAHPKFSEPNKLVIPAITLDDAPPLSGIPMSEAVPTLHDPRWGLGPSERSEGLDADAKIPEPPISAPSLPPLMASAAAAENAPSTRRSSSTNLAARPFATSKNADAAPETQSSLRAEIPLGELPPPPRTAFSKELPQSARYRSLVPPSEPPVAEARKPSEPKRPSARPGARAKSVPPRAPSVRPAAARPAEIFRSSKKSGSKASDAILRDKSLDEIILGYLAEELDK